MVAPQVVTARLRIRGGQPSTTAPQVGSLEVGSTIYPEAQVIGETVAGNATWFRLPQEQYVWGGGCTPAADDAASVQKTALNVHRRADGSIQALSGSEIKNIFGDFAFEEAGGGRIKIAKKWQEDNLTELATPWLEDVGCRKVTIHTKAVEPLRKAFDAVTAAGLHDAISTFDGLFVPRHKGWNPSRTLSSHSWGIAIDLNARWNGYGQEPAALGKPGSVRQLVSLFEAQGFAWGGYFQPLSITDGMHFELARTDL
jgi:hypothetical protein